MRAKVFRPIDDKNQRYKFDGHHKAHCNVALVWIDLSGMFVRLDFSSKGSSNDRGIFNQTDPFLRPEEFFDGEQHVLCDSGFVGTGRVVCPYKRGSGHDVPNRAEINRDVRSQRWINEHCIAILKNKFRSFMGCWPWREELWEVCLETVAMISNFIWRKTGSRIVPPARRIMERENERLLRT